MNLIWKTSGSPEHVGAKWLGSLEHAEPVSPGRRHELHEGPIVVGPTEVPSAPMTGRSALPATAAVWWTPRIAAIVTRQAGN